MRVAGLAARGDALKADADLLSDRIKAIRDEKSGVVAVAMAKQASVLEENQYLSKMQDQLGENSRENKVAEGEEKVAAAKAKFAAAEGSAAFAAAKRVVSAEERLEKVKESTYAKPKSIYYQVWRSIVCVFCGFFLGSLIAVPIGILCGLSKTFMAAMTPFIALFKPVSPIVWLPIALIVASAAIPAAESHWLTAWTYHVPILDTLEINPAFLASAATVALCSLWATMVNTALGVASVDKDHLNVAKVLKLGFWSRLFKIVLPSALPLMFAGMRISLGRGLDGAHRRRAAGLFRGHRQVRLGSVQQRGERFVREDDRGRLHRRPRRAAARSDHGRVPAAGFVRGKRGDGLKPYAQSTRMDADQRADEQSRPSHLRFIGVLCRPAPPCVDLRRMGRTAPSALPSAFIRVDARAKRPQLNRNP